MKTSVVMQSRIHQIRDLDAAKASPLWPDAVGFVRRILSPATRAEVRQAIARCTDERIPWVTPHHIGWGMAIRNELRANGYSEQHLGIGNLDNVYVDIIEAAVQE